MTKTFNNNVTTEINPYTDRVTVYTNNDAGYVKEEKKVNTFEQKMNKMNDAIAEARRRREYAELGIEF